MRLLSVILCLILIALAAGCAATGARPSPESERTPRPTAASTPRPTVASTPRATPAPTPEPDPEAGFMEAGCAVLYWMSDYGALFSEMGEAIEALDQAELERIADDMEIVTDFMRRILAEAPHWDPGEPWKLTFIRLLNDSEALANDLRDATTWTEAAEIALADTPAINERINESMAMMDALGFDRGGIC